MMFTERVIRGLCCQWHVATTDQSQVKVLHRQTREMLCKVPRRMLSVDT
jgi:hypothetical protein